MGYLGEWPEGVETVAVLTVLITDTQTHTHTHI